MAENVYNRLQNENDKFGHHYTKEQLDAELHEAAERKAAIDQNRSELAGQEVAFAKAIAADVKARQDEPGSLTRGDVENDLDAAAARKRAIDQDKSAKAGEDYKHVMEVVEQKKKSLEALQSEKEQLDAQLQRMSAKQQEMEARMAGKQS